LPQIRAHRKRRARGEPHVPVFDGIYPTLVIAVSGAVLYPG